MGFVPKSQITFYELKEHISHRLDGETYEIVSKWDTYSRLVIQRRDDE